jgi:hypothetical protein
MKNYELTINTKEADSLLERVVSYLPNPPVQQQKSPFFLSLEFYAEPEKIQELEKKLKADSLKYMILSKITKKVAKPRRILIKKPPATSSKKTAEGKVDLKQLDKKLEELLKEE